MSSTLDVAPSPAPQGARRTLRLGAPAVPGQINWYPLGPSVVLNGMVGTRTPVSGRVMSLAVSADGQRIYAGSANGGVWRSDDGGRTWYPLMNAFDLQPTTNHSDSLSVGAIAIDVRNPDRVYVGSGEGDLSPDNFPRGVGGGSFNGVGPLVSDDGGASWTRESGDANIQRGYFFALAVDPVDPDRVLAGTAQSVYRRQPRNRGVAGLPTPLPQSYFMKYAKSTGAYSINYWDPGGNADFVVQAGVGGGALPSEMTVLSFTMNSAPWILTYVPSRYLHWYYQQVGGDYHFYTVGGDGTLIEQNAAHVDKWEAGLILMVFQLTGLPHVVRYNPSTGRASLLVVNPNGTTTQVWTNQDWGKGLSQLVAFELGGVPHMITYSPGGAFSWSEAMLWRWTATGDRVRVWSKPRNDLGIGSTLMPFELNDVSFLQVYESSAFQVRVGRWGEDGSLTFVLATSAGLSARNIAFTPFEQGGEPRALGYSASDGQVGVFAYRLDASKTALRRVTLFTGKWANGLAFTAFQIGFMWAQMNVGVLGDQRATSVVVARGGDDTAYFAAFWDGGIYRSLDGGDTWTQVGANSPGDTSAAVGRITLSVLPTNPNTLFAQVQDGSVFRYDVGAGLGNNWVQITGEPAGYVGPQGWYDLVMAVAPDNVDRIYLGGSTVGAPLGAPVTWSGSIYRASVDVVGGTMAPTYIGTSTHADIHALVFTPSQPNDLWVACDGGVYFSNIPQGAAVDTLFQSMNAGLATMTSNHLGQHPTQDAILFSSTQDNGAPRYTGTAAWALPVPAGSLLGDSGYAVVDSNAANNGQNVIATYTENTIYASNDGGNTYARVAGQGTGQIDPLPLNDSANFYAPVVGSPSGMTDRVLFGSRALWVSDDFGVSWAQVGNLLGPAVANTDYNINAITISNDGLTVYVGTNNGQVYKYTDGGGAVWNLPVAALNPIGTFPASPITSIAIDPTNANAIYVTLAGNSAGWGAVPGWQRVWYFDGANWSARSGGAAGSATQLLNTQHNSIVFFDRNGALELYVGADLGVWKSTNGGQDWAPFSNALPEAAVLDLKVFPNAGPSNLPLLRAATHGRGAFEIVLQDAQTFKRSVQLYTRKTILDRGLYPVQDGAQDPTDVARTVNHRDGTDLKVIRPTGGPDSDTFTARSTILFPDFEMVADQSRDLRPNTRARLFLQVHNRGVTPADDVYVQVLVTKRPFIEPVPPINAVLSTLAAPPDVPSSLQPLVDSNMLVQDSADIWAGIFIVERSDVRAGFPEILSVDLPQGAFRKSGAYGLLAVIHSKGDRFTSNEQNTDTLVTNDPKVILKYLFVR